LTSLLLLAAAPALPAQQLVERATCTGHTVVVRQALLSPDGKLLASGGVGGRGAELKLWAATSGKEVRALAVARGSVDALAFSPDGKRLAAATRDAVQVWDVDAGREVAVCKPSDGPFGVLAFSPDGKRLAGASYYKAVRVWDARTGKELVSLGRELTNDPGTGLAFSKDLGTLAWGNYEEIELWDVTRGQRRAFLSGHGGQVWPATFSPDGKTLVAASSLRQARPFGARGEVRLWDVATRRARAVVADGLGIVWAMALSPDGKTVAVLDRTWDDEDNLKVLDVATGRHGAIPPPPVHSFLSLAYTPDGRLFVTGTNDDNAVKLWEVVPRKGPGK
jgi:WD40 repeat protein